MLTYAKSCPKSCIHRCWYTLVDAAEKSPHSIISRMVCAAALPPCHMPLCLSASFPILIQRHSSDAFMRWKSDLLSEGIQPCRYRLPSQINSWMQDMQTYRRTTKPGQLKIVPAPQRHQCSSTAAGVNRFQ